MIPLAILAATTTFYLSRVYDETSATRLLQFARSVMSSVEGRFDIAISGLQVLATADELVREDLVAFERHAKLFRETLLPAAANVVLADSTGFPVVNTATVPPRPLTPDVDHAAVEAYKKVFATGQIVLSRLFYGTLVKEHVVRINVPVRRGEKIIYVLAASITSRELSDFLAQQSYEGWTLAIWDSAHKVVARSRDWPKYVAHEASHTIMAALLEKEDRTLWTTTFDGTRVQTAIAYSPRLGISLGVGVPESVVVGPRNQVFLIIAVVSICCLFVSGLLASRLASRVLDADRHKDVLMAELNHRERNLLASIQGIAQQSRRSHASKEDSWHVFEQRIMSLAVAHQILTQAEWREVGLGKLVDAVLEPFASQSGALRVKGDSDVEVDSHTATVLALALNELATNALKYGALSVPTGVVELTWRRENKEFLKLFWSERGGPPVTRGTRRGFGSKLLEHGLGGQGSCALQFDPSGVRCEITLAT